MKIFKPLYDKILVWVSRDDSDKYLYALSFLESIVFPIPPDVMLAPMCAARPHDAVRLGLMTTLFSVIGGVLGYALGLFALTLVEPWLMGSSLWDDYVRVQDLFSKWGVWIILIAGFSPLPYKIFTVGAGAFHLFFPAFVIASLLGRGARFLLVAVLLKYLGPALLPKLERWAEGIGWLIVFVFIAILVHYYLNGI